MSYAINETVTVAVCAENLFDNFPDKDIRSRGLPNSNWYEATQARVEGGRYSDDDPLGYNGGFWYLRLGSKF